MKKLKQLFILVVLMFSIIISKAQSCTSPIVLTVDGSCSGTDSTNAVHYLKFTASQDNMRIKINIKNYSSGYYGVKLYNNDCGNLATNEISISPMVSGDSLDIFSMLTKGNEYLIELTRINPAGNYLVYNTCVKSFGLDNSLVGYSCTPTTSLCTSISNCELVCNGGFECMSAGTSTLGQIMLADNWGAATAGSTPDLFSGCCYGNANTPCNYFGYEASHSTGNAYAGILVYGGAYTEYIQTKLKSPLQAGKKYIISYYVSRAELPQAQILGMNIYMSPTAAFYATPLGTEIPTATLAPIAIVTNTTLLNSTTWQKVTVCYTPTTSTQQYLIVGRANLPVGYTAALNSPASPSCAPSPTTEGLVSYSGYGYLYLDDFSVQLMDVDAGPDYSVCIGSSVTLSPSFSCNVTPNIPLTYSWNPATALSSSTVFAPTSAPTTTTNYTLTATALGTNSVSCSVSDNMTVFTYPSSYIPPTPTITASSPSVCIGSIVSYTASGGAGPGTYTWYPGGVAGTTFTYGPMTGPETVTLVTGTTCTSQAVFTPSFPFDLPCGCVDGCQNSLGGTVGSQNTNSVYCVTSDITITGAATFTNSEFRMAPNIKITVPSSSTLTILGCHLFACGDMWQGIIVQDGGVLKLGTSSSGLTTMIEDAYTAIEVQAFTASVTSILTATNVIFNRNQVGIKLNDYTYNQTTYPYSISNNLFTSRTITYTTLSWPTTSTVKNSTITPLSLLETPYLNSTTYPAVALKAPLSTSYPSTGIVLSSVGYTSVSSTPTFKGITVGITGATSYNVFDNLRVGISADNSNLTVVNSIFQNGRTYGLGGSSGGRGISAVSTQLTYSTNPAVNNQLKVVPASGTSYANKFYELTRCVDVTGYLHTELTYNEAYSYANSYSTFTNINAIGGLGFNISTNRYHTMKVTDNKMYNLKDNIVFDITTGDVIVGTKVGYGRYAGSANFNNNKISIHPTTPSANECVNVGIAVNDAYAAASTSLATVGGSGFFVNTNTITSVHNGIGVYNVAYTSISVGSNSVTMVNEPNTIYGLPVQKGIEAAQVNNVSIYQNAVSGPATYTTDMTAIKTSMNSILSVKCNTTSSTVRGLDFNASQPSTTVEDNTMQSQTNGLSLNNNGVTGTLGSSTNPTNNLWLGTWTGTNYKTYTENPSSSAASSKIYVQWTASTSSLDPNGSGQTGGTFGQDDYFHGATTTSLTTILDVGSNTVTPGCRLGGGGSRMISSELSLELMEDLVQDKITYDANIAETRFIDKNRVYRLLKSDDSYLDRSQVLDIFLAGNSNSVMETLFSIEMDLLNGDRSQASSKINSLNSNGIEGNYKGFYNILLNAGDSLNSTDSLLLINLANSCPYTRGGVVYQARALYNQKYNVYLSYKDNCPKTSPNRLVNKPYNNEIKVVFNSKLYPNPNTGEFNIELIKATREQQIEISIADVTGKLVYNKNIQGTAINLKPELANGIYMVKVKMQDGTTDVHRLVISK